MVHHKNDKRDPDEHYPIVPRPDESVDEVVLRTHGLSQRTGEQAGSATKLQ